MTMGRRSRFEFRVEIINRDNFDSSDHESLKVIDDECSLGFDELMDAGSNHSFSQRLRTESQDSGFDLDNSEEWDNLLLSEAYAYVKEDITLDFQAQPAVDETIDGSLHSISKRPPLQVLLKQTSSRRMLMESARQSSSRRMLSCSGSVGSSGRSLLDSFTRGSSRSLLFPPMERRSSQSLLSDLKIEDAEEEPSLLLSSTSFISQGTTSSRRLQMLRQSSSRRMLLSTQSSSRRKLFSSAKQASSRRLLLSRQMSGHSILTRPRQKP